jgi:hypothetical protein
MMLDAIFLSNLTAFTLVGIGDLLVTIMPGADPTGWLFVVINFAFAVAFFVVGRVNMSSRVLRTANCSLLLHLAVTAVFGAAAAGEPRSLARRRHTCLNHVASRGRTRAGTTSKGAALCVALALP